MQKFCPFINGTCRTDCTFYNNMPIPFNNPSCMLLVKLNEISDKQDRNVKKPLSF